MNKGNILYEYRMEDTLNKYRSVPSVSKSEFLKKLIPGDIILAKTAEIDPSLSGISLVNMGSMILREFQKSPVNSSKLYIGNGEVVGYSAAPGVSGNEGIIKYNMSKYMDGQRRVLCVRPLEYTKDERMRAISYVKRKIGLGYDNSMILKSAWHRFTKKHVSAGVDPESLEMEDIKRPLICSSMIAFSIIYSGNKARFGNNPYEIWPVDILMSDQVVLPFRFSRSE